MKKQTILKNGLTVITHENPLANSVISSYWVKAGGNHELNYPYGIAHFIEHNLFNGTENRSKEDLQKEVFSYGGSFNAGTDSRCTMYYTELPKDASHIGIEVLTDMLFHSTFTEEMLEKEKKIVIQEIHRSEDNYNSFRPLLQNLFRNRPETESVLGTEESVSSITREDVLRFVDEFYQPSNMSFISVGNVKHEDVCEMLEKITPQQTKPVTHVIEPLIPYTLNGEEVITHKDLAQLHYRFALFAPNVDDKDRFAFRILTTVLGGSMDSRLFTKIREEKGMAYAVSMNYMTEKDYGLGYGYIGTTMNHKEEMEQILFGEFEDIKQNSITEEELNKTKRYLNGQNLISEDDMENVLNKLGSAFIKDIEDNSVEAFARELNEVTLEDVQRVAQKYLNKENMIFYLVKPNEENETNE